MTKETRTREAFLADRKDEIIRVVRMPTAVPVRKGHRVESVSAVQITYSWVGVDTLVFQETRLADETGRVQLADTLWADLDADKLGRYSMVQRSGSF